MNFRIFIVQKKLEIAMGKKINKKAGNSYEKQKTGKRDAIQEMKLMKHIIVPLP